MKVVVSGGRKFRNKTFIRKSLLMIHQEVNFSELIHGDAYGVDKICGAWAKDNNITVRPCPADWDDVDSEGAVVRYRRDGTPYNLLAGPIRNESMIIEYMPDLAIIFPGGTGTQDMRERCMEASIEIADMAMIHDHLKKSESFHF